MKETETDLLQMLEAIRVPLMLSDPEGTVLAQNRLWVGARSLLREGELERTIREAASSGQEAHLERERLNLSAVPLPGPELRVLVQLSTDEVQTELRAQLEDTVKTTASYQEKLSHFGTQNYIATSDRMIRIFTKAKQVAAYPTTILLLGETGVGKEVVASFIHRNSDRADKPFIKINCSAIPEPLMESELFGYEGGAFTGAREKGKMGLFELANHGTILLDEIGDMSLALQAKLLRTIQESEILRVGGSRSVHLDVRILSATSRDIEAMMAEGRFLDALYYRLNVVELQIPPLRERREDILPLAEFYLQHFCEKYKLTRELSQEVRECFIAYDWPGNVRELRNTVENLAVSAAETEIVRADLPTRLADTGRDGETHSRGRGESMRSAVEELQKEMVADALRSAGSLRKAAAALEMDPTTLHRLAKKLGVID
jgi:transcriptional regulator with PAS, ATPase and Fis domain